MEKKTKKAKLEIFKFLRNSVESQGYIAFDKISRWKINKYTLTRYFCKQKPCLQRKQ